LPSSAEAGPAAGPRILVDADACPVKEEIYRVAWRTSKTVKVKLSSGSHTINMNFENRGIGIDPVDLETIFQPFFRGRKARSFKGHGIGLSLVQRIITLHQGAIKVMSDDGLVLFSVNLPTSRLGQ
jgi:signal transduction histidine kinase